MGGAAIVPDLVRREPARTRKLTSITGNYAGGFSVNGLEPLTLWKESEL